MEQKHLGKIFAFILVMFIIAFGGYSETVLAAGMDMQLKIEFIPNAPAIR